MVQNPNDPQTVMEKLEGGPLASGEGRVFIHDIVLDEHSNMLIGNRQRGSNRSASSILVPSVKRLQTILLP
jgi:hypothetical protein